MDNKALELELALEEKLAQLLLLKIELVSVEVMEPELVGSEIGTEQVIALEIYWCWARELELVMKLTALANHDVFFWL
jgi:hypothetical protein